MAHTLKNNPALRTKAIDGCTKDWETRPRAERVGLAAYIGVSFEALPREWCRRTMNAIASGRLSYEDYVDASAGRWHEGGNDQFFRILRRG